MFVTAMQRTNHPETRGIDLEKSARAGVARQIIDL
jgi:hypothetical protein